MLNINNTFPIGIGTFRLDTNDYQTSLQGLLQSLNLWENYIDTSFLYQQWEVMHLLGKFIGQINRNDIYITTKLEPIIQQQNDIEKQLDTYLSLLWIAYVDCLMLHSPAFTKLSLLDTYKEMKKLVTKGKAKSLGISNTNLQQLSDLYPSYPIAIFEGIYNFECKIYEDIGVLDYCKAHNIAFVCYQPLRRNRTANRNYSLLVTLAEKYHKTQNQILLNRIIKEKGLLPLVKTSNPERIQENIASLNFTLEKADYQQLNDFRSEEFDSVKIDRNNQGGISIDQLANQFE